MNIKRYATVKASMRGMKMGMVFTKSMWIRWRASGHYCVVGYVHTGEFRRSTCRFISAFLNSYTTQGREVNHYSKACYRYSFHHPASQHEPRFYETGSPAFRGFAVWVLTTEINFVFDKCFTGRILRKFPTVSSSFLLLIILKNIVFN